MAHDDYTIVSALARITGSLPDSSQEGSFFIMGAKKIIRLTAQVLTSASLISCGIIAGLTPVGAMLGFTGFCLAFAQEDNQTPEEYRQAVVSHFEARGQVPPRWARGGAK